MRASLVAGRDAIFAPNAFIRIAADGKITLIMRDVEMGQGIWTGASMLMAEELDVGLDQVTPEFAPPDDKLYASPLLGIQATGGSTSIARRLGAIAQSRRRRRAPCWCRRPRSNGMSSPATCTVERGVVTHAASGRTATYGSSGRRRREPAAAADAPLKANDGLEADRHAAEAAGHADQGQRRDGLRHRRQDPGHEVRQRGDVPGYRRQAGQASTTRPRSG